MLNGDGPDKRMIDMAGAVADFAYKQGIGDAVAVDQLIQSYRGLRAEVERLRSEVLDLADAASTACRDAATAEAEVRRLSDAVRERPIRHLPVNGPDDRQPNAPDRGQLRDAATPASGRGRSSEQGEDDEAAVEKLTAELQALVDWFKKLTAELQALVDWFNDAPFPRAERLLHDLDEERGRDAR